MKNAGIFADALGEFAWLVPQHIAPDSTSAYHFFVPTFYGDERGIDYEAFQAACREENCVVNFGYNQVPAYQYALFREPLAYGRGCPTACPLYEGTYLVGDGLCPVAEDILPRMMLLNTLGPQDEISRRATALRRAADKIAQTVH